jgi:2-polyprenyl-6-hydroxyphenyl methylase/3-demethylubiquinone-9 3-methyltransferase
MTDKTTIDAVEVAKFAKHASQWWDTDGPFKTLHDINPARITFIESFIDITDSMVLDVGCGGGLLSEGLASKAAIVTGLDVEPDAIATAKSHAKQHKLRIKYVCQPIEEYKAATFDFITCMEMLEHVSCPQLVIEQCARLLKPGGYLFLSTINRTIKAYASVILAAEYLLGLLPRQTHDVDKFIKVSELSAMVRNAGLEMVAVSGLAYNPFKRHASLQSDVSVNYLMACKKN